MLAQSLIKTIHIHQLALRDYLMLIGGATGAIPTKILISPTIHLPRFIKTDSVSNEITLENVSGHHYDRYRCTD